MGLGKVISTLFGVLSLVTLIITLVTKSHDPLNLKTPIDPLWIPLKSPLRNPFRNGSLKGTLGPRKPIDPFEEPLKLLSPMIL